MALSLPSVSNSSSFSKPHNNISLLQSFSPRSQVVVTKCELNESNTKLDPKKGSKLEIGSPVVVIQAPQLLKTAASVPCLRANAGLVKAGDVGRIVSRKPKDVWAVRLSIGTYLIDGKYFKPLELDD